MFAAPASARYPRPLPNILAECAWFVRCSRSLSSLLPAFLVSGLMALLISAITLISLDLHGADFISAWLESWLVAWPIAFPVAWLAVPRRAATGAKTAASHGMGVASIESVSRRVTERQGRTVLRGLQSATLRG